jgi:hypothetical protein
LTQSPIPPLNDDPGTIIPFPGETFGLAEKIIFQVLIKLNSDFSFSFPCPVAPILWVVLFSVLYRGKRLAILNSEVFYMCRSVYKADLSLHKKYPICVALTEAEYVPSGTVQAKRS